MRAAAISLVGLGLGLALALLPAGCDGRVAHVFGGYAYDPTQDCLDLSGAIDVIDGPASPTPCNTLRCWVSSEGEAYVTNQACDAPPDYQDQTQSSSGPCVKALVAYGRDGHGLCPAPTDGGAGGGLGAGS